MEMIILAETYIQYKHEIISQLCPNHLWACFPVADQDGELLASSMFSVVRASLSPFLTLDPSAGPMHTPPTPTSMQHRGFLFVLER